MKTFINQRKTLTCMALAAALLGLAAIQAQAQSFTFNFADNTSDGWANTGFSGTPVATIQNLSGQNYLYLPFAGFQDGNVASGYAGNNIANFNSVMAAAINNPAGFDISYNWVVNTAGFSNATFLQLGTFVNTGSGFYKQDYGSPNEVQLNGTQLASGQTFSGSVTVNMAAVGFTGDANAATENFFRLGIVENTGSGTAGVGAYFTNISVFAVPEPASLALAGLGGLSMLFLRRRKA